MNTRHRHREQASLPSTLMYDTLNSFPKRTRVYAQRKFAQGSHLNTSSNGLSCNEATDFNERSGNMFGESRSRFAGSSENENHSQAYVAGKYQSVRPKTEDFLTFLCYRRTPLLPPELEILDSPPLSCMIGDHDESLEISSSIEPKSAKQNLIEKLERNTDGETKKSANLPTSMKSKLDDESSEDEDEIKTFGRVTRNSAAFLSASSSDVLPIISKKKVAHRKVPRRKLTLKSTSLGCVPKEHRAKASLSKKSHSSRHRLSLGHSKTNATQKVSRLLKRLNVTPVSFSTRDIRRVTRSQQNDKGTEEPYLESVNCTLNSNSGTSPESSSNTPVKNIPSSSGNRVSVMRNRSSTTPDCSPPLRRKSARSETSHLKAAKFSRRDDSKQVVLKRNTSLLRKDTKSGSRFVSSESKMNYVKTDDVQSETNSRERLQRRCRKVPCITDDLLLSSPPSSPPSAVLPPRDTPKEDTSNVSPIKSHRISTRRSSGFTEDCPSGRKCRNRVDNVDLTVVKKEFTSSSSNCEDAKESGLDIKAVSRVSIRVYDFYKRNRSPQKTVGCKNKHLRSQSSESQVKVKPTRAPSSIVTPPKRSLRKKSVGAKKISSFFNSFDSDFADFCSPDSDADNSPSPKRLRGKAYHSPFPKSSMRKCQPIDLLNPDSSNRRKKLSGERGFDDVPLSNVPGSSSGKNSSSPVIGSKQDCKKPRQERCSNEIVIKQEPIFENDSELTSTSTTGLANSNEEVNQSDSDIVHFSPNVSASRIGDSSKECELEKRGISWTCKTRVKRTLSLNDSTPSPVLNVQCKPRIKRCTSAESSLIKCKNRSKIIGKWNLPSSTSLHKISPKNRRTSTSSLKSGDSSLNAELESLAKVFQNEIDDSLYEEIEKDLNEGNKSPEHKNPVASVEASASENSTCVSSVSLENDVNSLDSQKMLNCTTRHSDSHESLAMKGTQLANVVSGSVVEMNVAQASIPAPQCFSSTAPQTSASVSTSTFFTPPTVCSLVESKERSSACAETSGQISSSQTLNETTLLSQTSGTQLYSSSLSARENSIAHFASNLNTTASSGFSPFLNLPIVSYQPPNCQVLSHSVPSFASMQTANGNIGNFNNTIISPFIDPSQAIRPPTVNLASNLHDSRGVEKGKGLKVNPVAKSISKQILIAPKPSKNSSHQNQVGNGVKGSLRPIQIAPKVTTGTVVASTSTGSVDSTSQLNPTAACVPTVPGLGHIIQGVPSHFQSPLNPQTHDVAAPYSFRALTPNFPSFASVTHAVQAVLSPSVPLPNNFSTPSATKILNQPVFVTSPVPNYAQNLVGSPFDLSFANNNITAGTLDGVAKILPPNVIGKVIPNSVPSSAIIPHGQTVVTMPSLCLAPNTVQSPSLGNPSLQPGQSPQILTVNMLPFEPQNSIQPSCIGNPSLSIPSTVQTFASLQNDVSLSENSQSFSFASQNTNSEIVNSSSCSSYRAPQINSEIDSNNQTVSISKNNELLLDLQPFVTSPAKVAKTMEDAQTFQSISINSTGRRAVTRVSQSSPPYLLSPSLRSQCSSLPPEPDLETSSMSEEASHEPSLSEEALHEPSLSEKAPHEPSLIEESLGNKKSSSSKLESVVNNDSLVDCRKKDENCISPDSFTRSDLSLSEPNLIPSNMDGSKLINAHSRVVGDEKKLSKSPLHPFASNSSSTVNNSKKSEHINKTIKASKILIKKNIFKSQNQIDSKKREAFSPLHESSIYAFDSEAETSLSEDFCMRRAKNAKVSCSLKTTNPCSSNEIKAVSKQKLISVQSNASKRKKDSHKNNPAIDSEKINSGHKSEIQAAKIKEQDNLTVPKSKSVECKSSSSIAIQCDLEIGSKDKKPKIDGQNESSNDKSLDASHQNPLPPSASPFYYLPLAMATLGEKLPAQLVQQMLSKTQGLIGAAEAGLILQQAAELSRQYRTDQTDSKCGKSSSVKPISPTSASVALRKALQANLASIAEAEKSVEKHSSNCTDSDQLPGPSGSRVIGENDDVVNDTNETQNNDLPKSKKSHGSLKLKSLEISISSVVDDNELSNDLCDSESKNLKSFVETRQENLSKSTFTASRENTKNHSKAKSITSKEKQKEITKNRPTSKSSKNTPKEKEITKNHLNSKSTAITPTENQRETSQSPTNSNHRITKRRSGRSSTLASTKATESDQFEVEALRKVRRARRGVRRISSTTPTSSIRGSLSPRIPDLPRTSSEDVASPMSIDEYSSNSKSESKSKHPVTGSSKLNNGFSGFFSSSLSEDPVIEPGGSLAVSEDPRLTTAPSFHPSEQTFGDPLEYIASIEAEASPFGMCRVVPPPGFRPECRVSDDMRFAVSNQYVQRMLHRCGPCDRLLLAVKMCLRRQNVVLSSNPLIGGVEVDLVNLYRAVEDLGGLMRVIERDLWPRVADRLKIPPARSSNDVVAKLDSIYCKFLLPFATLSDGERKELLLQIDTLCDRIRSSDECSSSHSDAEDESDVLESLECITRGKSTTLGAFYRTARNVARQWRTDPEGLKFDERYWTLVEKADRHVCVHTANIDTSERGYGFTTTVHKRKDSSVDSKHPWNLKSVCQNPRSILRSMSDVIGVTAPTLHVGMMFSTACWYKDPHGLPWMEYLHSGASKIWYSVSSEDEDKFQAAVKKFASRIIKDSSLWLPSDAVMIPPEYLIEEGVRVCRLVQEPGQFVVVFPQAFSSSVCAGYLVSESAFFARPRYFDIADKCFDIMTECSEPSMFSLDELALSVATDNRAPLEALQRARKSVVTLIDRERKQRVKLQKLGLCSSGGGGHFPSSVEEGDEDGCEVCRQRLYSSMVVNDSDDPTYYCLSHAISRLTGEDDNSSEDELEDLQIDLCKLFYRHSLPELTNILKQMDEQIRLKSEKKSTSNRENYSS